MLRSLILVALLSCIAFAEITKDAKLAKDEEVMFEQTHEKRDVAVGTSLEAAIIPGTSLHGTSVEGLKTKGYTVQLFGSIENFSRWTMYSKGCEVKTGQSSHPMVNVLAGQKEGFASHKTSGSSHGTWQYCRYNQNGKTIHIMWMLPWSRFWYSNYLAIGISPLGIESTANDMYRHVPDYAVLKKFRKDNKPIKMCSQQICIKAVMGTSAIAKLTIKVYPTHFAATAPSVQLSMKHLANPVGAWYDFMMNEFDLTYKNVFPVRPVPMTVQYRDQVPIAVQFQDDKQDLML